MCFPSTSSRDERTTTHRQDNTRNIHVAAAASPRLVSTEHPRRGRGVAASRLHEIATSRPRCLRDTSPRNIHVAAAASPRHVSRETTSRRVMTVSLRYRRVPTRPRGGRRPRAAGRRGRLASPSPGPASSAASDTAPSSGARGSAPPSPGASGSQWSRSSSGGKAQGATPRQIAKTGFALLPAWNQRRVSSPRRLRRGWFAG